MTEEISDEQRAAVREKYGKSTTEATSKNSSLSALGWLSGIGFAITVIAMFVVGSAPNPGPITMLFWPAMLTVGPTVGFASLIAYLAVKAIISSRK